MWERKIAQDDRIFDCANSPEICAVWKIMLPGGSRPSPTDSNGVRPAICNVIERGSDASAAGGRVSELSEWQRSKKSRKSVSPMIFSGTATGSYFLVSPRK